MNCWEISFFLFLSIVLFSGVTILLSLTVFMNMVQNIMPNTSDAVPLIGQCLFAMDRCVIDPWVSPLCVEPILTCTRQIYWVTMSSKEWNDYCVMSLLYITFNLSWISKQSDQNDTKSLSLFFIYFHLENEWSSLQRAGFYHIIHGHKKW